MRFDINYTTSSLKKNEDLEFLLSGLEKKGVLFVTYSFEKWYNNNIKWSIIFPVPNCKLGQTPRQKTKELFHGICFVFLIDEA
jgi:hypothetical protein